MKTPRLSNFRLMILGALTAASVASASTVVLGGSVGTTATVSSPATAGASSLNLGGLGTAIGEQIVKVADVTLTTNNASGLTLTVTSGKLTNGTTSSDIEYKVLTVGDEGTAPLSAAFTVPSGTSYTYSNDLTTDERDLYIAYTPAANQDPGNYAATITLTVLDDA